MWGFAKSARLRHESPPAGSPHSQPVRTHQDPYDWISAYLEAKGLRGFTRVLIAAGILAIGSLPLVMLFSSSWPSGAIGQTTSIAITVCCAVTAGSWLADWPTRNQSVLFVVIATACIAAACLVDPDPQSGLMGGFAFVALAVYVAFFHRFWLLVAYLTIALTVAGYLALRLARTSGDPVLAACKFVLVLVALLVASLCLHGILRLLRADAGLGTTDSLTGLLTRPGFKKAAVRLLAPRSAKSARTAEVFAVYVIDLDQFKAVNDNKGHAEGDRALAAVADALSGAVRPSAPVGRLGGEEFAVADLVPRSEVETIAERLRRSVAATTFGITASVGAAVADPRALANKDFHDSLNRLMDRADAAMYDAKRAGGDRYSIAGSRRRPPGSPPTGPQPILSPGADHGQEATRNGSSPDSGRWPALPDVGRVPGPDPSWSTQWS